MRLRKILVFHPVQIIRNRIKHSLLSEFSDAVAVDAATEEKLAEQLEAQRFEVLILDGSSLLKAGGSMLQKIRETSRNPEISVVAVIEPGNAGRSEEILKAGAGHCLAIPFQSADLKQVIHEVCNPRSWRVDERVHIPDAGLLVHVPGADIQAELINISKGGVLCELVYRGEALDVLNKIEVTLRITDPDFTFEVRNLSGRVSRVNITGWNENGAAERLRMTILFNELPSKTVKLLGEALAMARDRYKAEFDLEG